MRKIFDNFSNWFDFEGVIKGLISNVPGEFTGRAKKFILKGLNFFNVSIGCPQLCLKRQDEINQKSVKHFWCQTLN